jgi:hypothetical protein
MPAEEKGKRPSCFLKCCSYEKRWADFAKPGSGQTEGGREIDLDLTKKGEKACRRREGAA